MVLIVSIVLYYTYTIYIVNQQYLRRRVIAIPKRFGDTLSSAAGSISKI